MLDLTTVTLLARLKIFAKQAGINIDLVKMSQDMEYATLMLKEMSRSDDSEVVLIVINLMNQFGIIKAPSSEANHNAEKKNVGHYFGALR